MTQPLDILESQPMESQDFNPEGDELNQSVLDPSAAERDWEGSGVRIEEADSSQWGENDAPAVPSDLSLERFSEGVEECTEEIPTVILPSQVVGLESFGMTDVGHHRSHNEDFFVIDNRMTHLMDPEQTQVYSRGIYILCDGMGGHAQGEVASRMAAETLASYFTEHWKEEMPSEMAVKEAIYWTNQTLHTLNESQTRFGIRCMGTTLVMAMLQDTQFRFAHVGDSRLYRITHRHGLQQLTVDHEVGQRDIRRGVPPEVAYARPDAYQLTQALGPRPAYAIHPEVKSLNLSEDTVFLLCSDGMTDNQLLERFEADYLTPLLDFHRPLEAGIRALIELANAENGHDNVTVVGIRVKVVPPLEPPLFLRD